MSNNLENNKYYKKILELEGIKPSKKFGQNFIFDKNILNKIVSLLDPSSTDLVIEIGPGLGGLTEAMLDKGFENILLIEKDKQFSKILNDIKSRFPKNLDLQFEDALNFDFTSLDFKNISVISNLPYNVASKILTKLLFEQYNSKKFDNLILMFQREVAENRLHEAGKTIGTLLVMLEDYPGDLSIIIEQVKEVENLLSKHEKIKFGPALTFISELLTRGR